MKITFNNGMEMEITEAPLKQEQPQPPLLVPKEHRQVYAALVSAPPPPSSPITAWPLSKFINEYTDWWNSSRAVALR